MEESVAWSDSLAILPAAPMHLAEGEQAGLKVDLQEARKVGQARDSARAKSERRPLSKLGR